MQNKVRSMTLRAGVLAALVVTTIAATAQTPAPAEVKKGWETTAAATLTLTRGNSHSTLTTGTLDSKRKWEKDEALLGIAGGYGSSDGDKNTEFVNGFAQYNRLFSERTYGGIRVDGNYDGIANLDYRFRISPLVGYYLIKNAKTTLTVEAGPSFVFEKVGEVDENGTVTNSVTESYVGLRIGERFDHKLTETTKIWQSIEYIPDVSEFTDRYVITFEAGIDTAITKKWSLRVLFQDIYNNAPGAGNERNDVRLLAGTAYKF